MVLNVLYKPLLILLPIFDTNLATSPSFPSCYAKSPITYLAPDNKAGAIAKANGPTTYYPTNYFILLMYIF